MGPTLIVNDQICDLRFYPILIYQPLKDEGLGLPRRARKFGDLMIMTFKMNRTWVAHIVAQKFTHYFKKGKKKRKTMQSFCVTRKRKNSIMIMLCQLNFIYENLFVSTNEGCTISWTWKDSKMLNITAKHFSILNNTAPASWVAHIPRAFLTHYPRSYYNPMPLTSLSKISFLRELTFDQ